METQTSLGQFAVGDEVILMEKTMSGESHDTTGKIIDVREILGKVTYVVETSNGTRKVVGARQIIKVG
jgi:hypothetical protein